MTWADRVRVLSVRTKRRYAARCRDPRARSVPRGSGCCRTEHMFFEPARILAVRELILATDSADRARALDKLRPVQHADFVGIFRVMDGLP